MFSARESNLDHDRKRPNHVFPSVRGSQALYFRSLEEVRIVFTQETLDRRSIYACIIVAVAKEGDGEQRRQVWVVEVHQSTPKPVHLKFE